jgi:hypothetical protein
MDVPSELVIIYVTLVVSVILILAIFDGGDKR